MGKYKQGILGPFSGKVGQVVGSFWNGVYYMRSLAPNVANPRTPEQMQVRANFALLSYTLKNMLIGIRAGFKALSEQSSWSAAMSLNWRVLTALHPDVPWHSIPMDALVLTNGSYNFEVDVVKGRTGDLECTWSPITEDAGLAAGSVGVLVFNEANNRAEFFRADMSAASVVVSPAGLLTGTQDVLDVYAFGYSRDNSTTQSYFHFTNE